MSDDIPQPEDGFYALITGVNSGLGFGTACRLIDEFLHTRSQSQSLILIITTRSKRKGDDTVQQLQHHLENVCRKSEKTVPGISKLLQRRVHIRNEMVDLTSLVSVQKLAKKLRDTIPKLDALVFNAGIGGWEGLNWFRAVWEVLTGTKNAVTYPTFKKSGVGWVTKPQLPETAEGKKADEPPLGEVFCANVFGHYLLGHYLAPLLARHGRDEETRGRIIWISSLEAYGHTFNFEDFQGLRSNQPYEASKRLTDILAITSTFESTSQHVNRYLGNPEDTDKTTKPRLYVAHPGICGTSIVPLPWILSMAMFGAFFIARLLGSQWHAVTADKGACAAVWLALQKQADLDSMERTGGVGKWGSATDFWGRERAERTEVDGWGWGGKIENTKGRKGRHPYAKDLTEEDKVEFEMLGGRVWEEMERLREEWEGRLEDAGVGVKME